MINKLFLSTALAVTTVGMGAFTQAAQAGVIVQPIGVSTSMGNLDGSFFEIGTIIDQSGLSITYTSGVDDFDTYIGLGPTQPLLESDNYWISSIESTIGTITFDLGSSLTTTRLAFWDGGNERQSITAFEVYSDDDGNFGNGGTTLLGSFNRTNSNPFISVVEVFDFTDATTQFIHFNVTANGGDPFNQIAEVAFEAEANITSTPEPSTIISLAMVGGSLLLSKRVKRS